MSKHDQIGKFLLVFLFEYNDPLCESGQAICQQGLAVQSFRRRPCYILLYWLFNRDPFNGVDPRKPNRGFDHCSPYKKSEDFTLNISC